MQIVRRYEPDLQAQVEALLLLLQCGVRPATDAEGLATSQPLGEAEPCPHRSTPQGGNHARQ